MTEYTYTTDWQGNVMSITIGDLTLTRVEILNLFGRSYDQQFPHVIYPYNKKYIDDMINMIVFAHLHGDLQRYLGLDAVGAP